MTKERTEKSYPQPLTTLSVEDAKKQVPELFSLTGDFQARTIDTGTALATRELTAVRGSNLFGQAMAIVKGLEDTSYIFCKTVQDTIGVEGLTTHQLQVIDDTLPLASAAIIVLDQTDGAETTTASRANRIERELQLKGIPILTKLIIPTEKSSLQVGFHPSTDTLYTKKGSDATDAQVSVFRGFGIIDEAVIAKARDTRKAHLLQTLQSKIFSFVTREQALGNTGKEMEVLRELRAYIEMLGLEWEAKQFEKANWTGPFNRLKNERRKTL